MGTETAAMTLEEAAWMEDEDFDEDAIGIPVACTLSDLDEFRKAPEAPTPVPDVKSSQTSDDSVESNAPTPEPTVFASETLDRLLLHLASDVFVNAESVFDVSDEDDDFGVRFTVGHLDKNFRLPTLSLCQAHAVTNTVCSTLEEAKKSMPSYKPSDSSRRGIQPIPGPADLNPLFCLPIVPKRPSPSLSPQSLSPPPPKKAPHTPTPTPPVQPVLLCHTRRRKNIQPPLRYADPDFKLGDEGAEEEEEAMDEEKTVEEDDITVTATIPAPSTSSGLPARLSAYVGGSEDADADWLVEEGMERLQGIVFPNVWSSVDSARLFRAARAQIELLNRGYSERRTRIAHLLRAQRTLYGRLCLRLRVAARSQKARNRREQEINATIRDAL